MSALGSGSSFVSAAQRYAAVALGSALGGVARWAISSTWPAGADGHIPYGTLCVNVTGSFVIGLYAAAILGGRRHIGGAWQREFFVTGFCGGYTTFSIFSLEALSLLEAGHAASSALYVALSLTGWLTSVWAGYALGVRMSRDRHRAWRTPPRR